MNRTDTCACGYDWCKNTEPVVSQLVIADSGVNEDPMHVSTWAAVERKAARASNAWIKRVRTARVYVPPAPDYSDKGVKRWLRSIVNTNMAALAKSNGR